MSNDNGRHWFCWNRFIEYTEERNVIKYLNHVGFEWVDFGVEIQPDGNDRLNIISPDKKEKLTLSLSLTESRVTLVDVRYNIEYYFEVQQDTNGDINILKPDMINDHYPPGVLLSDRIEYYVKHNLLIVPFNPNEEHFKAASYDFTLGNIYKRGEKVSTLLKEHSDLTIQPHEAVLVRTKEHLNMPKFLIGRWNLRVSRVYQGLVWVGGIHIDPGWEGELWCPIYNLSKDPVTIHSGDTFASIDFEKTTPFNEKSIVYERSRGNPRHPGSGLEILRDDVEDFPRRLNQFQTMTFTLIGIIVAALAILSALSLGGANTETGRVLLPDHLVLATFWMSIIALGMSSISFISFSLKKFRREPKERK